VRSLEAVMPKSKLNKRVVEAAEPNVKDIILWDTELRGFGCKITPKGKRVYFAYYRTPVGQQRRPKIGDHGPMTCEEARDIARQWLAKARTGSDVSAARKAERAAPTMSDLAERYLTDHAELKKKPKSVASDKSLLRLHILPALGIMKVANVSRAEVIKLHHSMRQTPGAANRALALLSKMFNLAEKWGVRPDGSNPCRHVEKNPERKFERYLTANEFARLGDALNEAERTQTEMPSVIGAIRLLAFTGCRLSEILTLRWDWIDRERGCLNLPDSKTGRKTVYLGAPALEVLNRIEKEPENPYVITGRNPGTHLVNIRKPWHRIRSNAGLDELRIHDLRHSFASFGAGAGLSLPMIGKMLGHTQAQTTQRYAHLGADPLKRAVDTVTSDIAAAMKSDMTRIVEVSAKKH
jgi:integrase